MSHAFQFYEGIGLTTQEQAFVQDLALAAVFDYGNVVLLPASSSGLFLRDDGEWAAPLAGRFIEISPTSGVVDGANTSFQFAQKPDYIISDGVWYRLNNGWTWSAPLVALTVPPQYDLYGFII